MEANVNKLFGAFILILIAVALIPEIFTSLAGIGGVGSDVPSWLTTAITIVVGAGILFLVWRSISTK